MACKHSFLCWFCRQFAEVLGYHGNWQPFLFGKYEISKFKNTICVWLLRFADSNKTRILATEVEGSWLLSLVLLKVNYFAIKY